MITQSAKTIPNGDQSAEKMTKREAFAIRLMAASRCAALNFDATHLAKQALVDADALLAALEQKA
ncbi:hypothetical protein FHR47_002283 [Xanthomonas arboricola]|uniref:hypothetical protein n=1 Tax=Xanthomonas cannabis TaxID=1885674 RepID=UPI00161A3C3B|nr:hypothetical protein [Xanthomonas cannabis]MBB3802035.1 hypothetical protein [Xanthomonas cannabis]